MDVGGINVGAATAPVFQDELCLRCQKNFQNFLDEFRDPDNQEAVYKARVLELAEPERSMLVVDFSSVEETDADLATAILSDYYRLYPYLCQAVKTFVADNIAENLSKKDFFVSFVNVANRIKVRELTSEKIGRLLRISGQVVRTHAVHPELVKGTFVCSDCNQVIEGVEQQFKYSQPSRCSNPRCENRTRFVLDVHRSVFIDFQKVRIQETQAELPRGNIPRSVEVILRAECVEQAQPGDRTDFTGTLIVVPDVSQLAMPGARAESSSRHRGNNPNDNEGLRGLKALGVRDLSYRTAFLACSVEPTNPRLGGKDFSMDNPSMEKLESVLTQDEFKQIVDMTQDVNLRSNLAGSLYPSIYGCDEIKHGTLLMLFGGVPKTTSEGTTLRGDLNVCIVGDPSTAKSQVLKQIEEFLPRSVYTSGKASTSAGLTAAVVRDEETGEFVIEAGALMLADNGVCCIDEFDKMDLKDQVAIHEAMEQQTISITKAGIKATLNARASILAAANPIGGRYERSKSLKQNINLSAPILSRFDLFFILVDECSEVTDYAIARQILNLHRLREESIHRKYSLADIQRYIVFARMFKPKISEPAQRELVESYKRLRLRDGTSAGYNSWRITVRQLESLIRLSEATARMHCLDEVTAQHVKTAYNLLNKSIIRVEQPDIELEDDEQAMAAMLEEDEEEAAPNGEAAMDESPDGPADAANVHPEGGGAAADSHKLKLSYEKYKRMANMMVLHLRQLEQQAEDDPEFEPGLPKSELSTWYLNEISDEIETVEQLQEMKHLCERVIHRLIHTDNVLIQLDHLTKTGPDGKELPAENPILIVHPNYIIQD